MKKIFITTIVFAITIVVFTGCQKDTTLTIKPTPKVISGPVYFTKVLAPLFAANCGVAGCHVAGGQAPDFTASNAYNSIVSTPGLISISNPESSKLYELMTGKLSPAMPMGKPSNPSDINDLLLAWIKQGAKKN